MPNAKLLSRLGLLAALGLVAWIVTSQVGFASRKLFWFDEGYDFAHVCDASYGEIITSGAPHQCSPPPLYHLLEKAVVNLSPRHGFGENIFTTLRAISLASSAIVLVLLLLALRPAGVAATLLALAALNAQPAYHHFAAESRPYLLWVMLLTLVNVLAAWLSTDHPARTPLWKRLAFGAACIALTLTSTPGLIQGLCAAAILVFVWYRRDGKKSAAAALRWLVPVAVACLVIGLFYPVKPCSDTGEHDLLKTGNPALIVNVLRLLWPAGSPLLLAGNLLFLAGLAVSLARLKGKATKRGSLDTLSLLMLAGVGQGLATGVLAALRHYPFMPRIFLYLTVCHAVLAALGAHWCLERLSTQAKTAARAALVLASTLELAFSLSSGGHLNFADTVGDATVLLAHIKTTHCVEHDGALTLYVKKDDGPEFAPNFLGLIARELRECGWRASGKRTIVLARADGGPGAWYELATQMPEGYAPLTVCGIPAELLP